MKFFSAFFAITLITAFNLSASASQADDNHTCAAHFNDLVTTLDQKVNETVIRQVNDVLITAYRKIGLTVTPQMIQVSSSHSEMAPLYGDVTYTFDIQVQNGKDSLRAQAQNLNERYFGSVDRKNAYDALGRLTGTRLICQLSLYLHRTEIKNSATGAFIGEIEADSINTELEFP